MIPSGCSIRIGSDTNRIPLISQTGVSRIRALGMGFSPLFIFFLCYLEKKTKGRNKLGIKTNAHRANS